MDPECPYSNWSDDYPTTMPDVEHTYMKGGVQYYMKMQVARKELENMSARQILIAARRETVSSRQAFVDDKVCQFQQIIKLSNDYIENNDVKRWQAEAIYKEQHKLVLEKTAEIKRLRRTLAETIALRDKRKTAHDKSVALQKNIEEALYKSLGLQNMECILKRNTSLNMSLVELRKRARVKMDEYQVEKLAMQRLLAQKQEEILQMGVQVSELTRRLLDTSKEVFLWTGVLDRFFARAEDRDIEAGKVRYVGFTMYRTICVYQHKEPIKESLDEQFDHVRLFMKLNQQILKELKSCAKSEKPTTA